MGWLRAKKDWPELLYNIYQNFETVLDCVVNKLKVYYYAIQNGLKMLIKCCIEIQVNLLFCSQSAHTSRN